MKTPDYMNYKEYKKNKVPAESKKALIFFVATFFFMLIVFTAVAKQLSPDIDVAIGDDTDLEAKESGFGVKRFIDDRLKLIQMEDNMAGASKSVLDKAKDEDDIFVPELDEKVRVPQKQKQEPEEDKTKPEGNSSLPSVERELAQPVVLPVQQSVSKVVVGYYTTAQQAKVAQGILVDSGLGLNPFIKNLGGHYTLQVGSYTDRAKAESLTADLLRNNFPARIIQE